MSDDFWMKPSAKWIVTVGAAVVSLGCCCCAMYGISTGYFATLTQGNIPSSFQDSFQVGRQLGQSNPLFGLLSLGTFCVPPLIMFPAAFAAYFFLNRYQQGKKAANPPASSVPPPGNG